MTNYNELSNFEINKLVAKYEYNQYDRVKNFGSGNVSFAKGIRGDSVLIATGKDFPVSIDYCNNWKDIGPILIQEGFDLMNKLDGEWCVQDPLFEGNFALAPEAIDKNPCRAIAICYLMKRDGESEIRKSRN
jgi:hypothetical protein